MKRYVPLLLVLPLMLGGCIARAAADIVTAPVRVASKAVDMATTSQSEADEKRGRELRRQEEEVGKLRRLYDQQLDACNDGSPRACAQAQTTYAEIQSRVRNLPPPPPEPR